MLTATAIKALNPKEKSYKVSDAEGLYIEVLPSGAKSWRFKYRFKGKEKRLVFGLFPAIGLSDARKMLRDTKELLAHGEDPAQKKQLEETPKRTFELVAREWAEKQRPAWSDVHHGTVLYRLERFAFGVVGDKEIDKLSPPEILTILRRIEEQGKHDTAYRVQGIISQVMRYAVACGYCSSDPSRDLRGALTAHVETPRAALTEPADVANLMASIHNYQGSIIMRYAMLWSAYTFCRPGEIRKAEWQEINVDREVWIIPPEKMKMRREHRVPLSRQCLKILKELQEFKFSERWLFPSPLKHKELSEAGVLTALRRMGYEKNEMSAHGFRAMASTRLNELGWNSDVIEIQLAHVDKNTVRAAYNRAQYWLERKKMMQEWADYLDTLTPGGNPREMRKVKAGARG